MTPDALSKVLTRSSRYIKEEGSLRERLWCGRRDLNPGSQAWKACVLNQLDDDRHSDTVVLETKKAIDSTLTMLTNDGLKKDTVMAVYINSYDLLIINIGRIL
jgi:hypothetical protein